MGMAYGRVSCLCTGRVSVVPPLAAAVPSLDIDAATYGLDYQYSANLLGLALEVAWTSVEGPRLGSTAGVWIRCNSRRDRVASPSGTTRRTDFARGGRASGELWSGWRIRLGANPHCSLLRVHPVV